jgi:hypothetical protein
MKFLATLLGLFILIFSGCRVEDVTGLYRAKGGDESCSSIEIKSDSTFRYNWVVSMNHGETTGTWVKNKNLLILNSLKQPKRDTLQKFKIKNQFSTKSDSIKIKIYFPDSSLLMSHPFCIIYKGRSEKLYVNQSFNGTISILKQDFDSLKILSSGYTDVIHSTGYYDVLLDSKTKNNLEIFLCIDPDWGYEYFTNKPIKIKKRELVKMVIDNVYYMGSVFKKEK